MTEQHTGRAFGRSSAKHRAAEPGQPRQDRQAKKSHRQHRSSQSVWVTLAFLAFLAFLVYFLPPFRLQTVTISPTRAMTTAEIEAVLPVKLGQHLLKSLGPDLPHLFSLRYGLVEETLLAKFPYIRQVEARLSFPATMAIDIEERIEVAYVAIPDGCVMLDKEGYALRILPQAPAGIPVIEGVSVTSLELGAKLSVNAPDAMRSAVSLLGAIIDADKDTRTPQLLLPQISKIRPLADNRLYLTLVLPASGDELTVAAKNDGKQLEDMLWLRFAMDQGALDNRGKGVLDMTGSRTIFIPDP